MHAYTQVQSNVSAPSGMTKSKVCSSMNRTSSHHMFALRSLIDQLIDDICKLVIGCMHCQMSKRNWKHQALTWW